MKSMAFKMWFVFWSICLTLVAFGSWRGNVHFGWGIADFVFFGLIILTIVIIDVIFLFTLRLKSNLYGKQKVLFWISLISLFYIFLQMTVFRGEASPWNGQILF